MSILLRIRHTIPVVKLFPLKTLKKRWIEKLHVVKHSLGYGGAATIGRDGPNLILKFNSNCEVASKDQLIQLPEDEMIFQHVKVFGEWGGVESDFLASKIHHLVDSGTNSDEIVFIDLGANVGLVTIQTLRNSPIGIRGIAVEPLPILVQALEFNLKSLVPLSPVKILPYAIGEVSGVAEMSIDIRNYGSSTLNALNAPGASNLEVKVVSAESFADKELLGGNIFVLKSDLEGYDCAVLAALPARVWSSIFAGVIEVTSDATVDLAHLPLLLNNLSQFGLLSWQASMSAPVSISDIHHFWAGIIGEVRNLYFSRA
jgi:hypothetical protein